MPDLATQVVDQDGLTPAYTAAVAAQKLVPGEKTFVHVKNGGAGATIVTLVTPKTESGLAVADNTVSIAAAGEAFIGPLPSRLYADPTDLQKAAINYSVTTSVTVAVLALG